MTKRKHDVIRMPAIDKRTGEHIIVFMEIDYLPIPKERKNAKV